MKSNSPEIQEKSPKAPPRRRRSQAQRTAETRRKVLDAAVACLAEEGYAATTTQKIARRAGVTWGGIQHHFPDKEAIHGAVVEHVLGELEGRIEDVSAAGMPVEARVRTFLERTWDYFRRAQFRAYLEVVVNQRGEQRAAALLPSVRDLVFRIWGRAFGDLHIPPAREALAMRYLFATVSGLVIDDMLQGDPSGVDQVLDLVCRTTVGILEGREP